MFYGLAPVYLSQLIITKTSSRYNLRSSYDDTLLGYPFRRIKVTLGDRAFVNAATTLWNALPINIRRANSVDNFKSLLKTHLFKLAFYCFCCFLIVFLLVSIFF